MWYQAPAHPELSTAAGDVRAARYNVAGFWPTAFFDGINKAPQLSDSFYQVYDDMIVGARSNSAVLEMTLDSATTRLDSAELSIGVHITPTDSLIDEMNGLMLVAVVYEDSAPYYSMLRQDTTYVRFCARRVIGDTWGVPVRLDFGQDYDTVLTTPLGGWKRPHLGVAVFVQDTSSLRVLQSVGKRKFED